MPRLRGPGLTLLALMISALPCVAQSGSFGSTVVIDGEARAYSLNLLNHHEIVNAGISGLPIAAVWRPSFGIAIRPTSMSGGPRSCC